MSGIISLLIFLLMIASVWVIFQNAGLEGWKCLIPIYNTYCLFKITWGNGWLFLSMLVPLVNAVVGVITTYKLSKVFGKGLGFCIGLIVIPVIFYPLLAFSDAKYLGVQR